MTARLFALIPARGGSKGIPQKNIANLHGRPLLAHTVQVAKEISQIHEVVVSSDSSEILAAAEKSGARALDRPAEYATDTASADSVIFHFLAVTDLRDDDVIILLQPTSPLRSVQDLRHALAKFTGTGCVMSITETSECPYKVFTLAADQTLVPLFGEDDAFKPRQSFPVTYKPNGAIYIFTAGAFRAHDRIPRHPLIPSIMSPERSLDIDTPADLRRAEEFLKRQNL